jgi:hypothetical protein
VKSYCSLLAFVGILCAGLAAQQASIGATEDKMVVMSKLAHTIDIKKAKVGDKISLQMMDNIRRRDGKIIPYGKCSVVGHISAVQAPTKENPQSMIAIEFDRIKMKGEDDLPITATIFGMEPAYRHFAPNLDSRNSVPTSGDDPQMRAAPPMVDSNGRAVIPSHAPLNGNGPVPRVNMEKQPSRIENLEIEADEANWTTTITSNSKERLLIEDNTIIKLIVRTHGSLISVSD